MSLDADFSRHCLRRYADMPPCYGRRRFRRDTLTLLITPALPLSMFSRCHFRRRSFAAFDADAVIYFRYAMLFAFDYVDISAAAADIRFFMPPFSPMLRRYAAAIDALDTLCFRR